MNGRTPMIAPHRLRIISAIGVMLGLASCAQLEKEQPPTIITTGGHGIQVGQTIQITATTINATDMEYSFVSNNSAIAAVDATGTVTGIAPGETMVVVTGLQSQATANHPIVVIAPSNDIEPPPPTDIAPEDVPFYQAWRLSGHADATSPAFNHWNDAGTVPVACARCHAGAGFIDYLGGDGTAPGTVDKPAPVQSVIDCQTCHSPAANQLAQVTFPSGKIVKDLGGEARCMTCHQGRASGATVEQVIANAGVTSDDETNSILGFTNIHDYPAAATLYAGVAGGGYQYKDAVYDTRFRHVESFNTCIGCHDPHSTRVRYDLCSSCHAGVSNVDTARDIRMISSYSRDYDGDGNRDEGIFHELIGLRDKLLTAIQRYGAERATPICYGETGYPYWFKDADGDGTCSPAEQTPDGRFNNWTARLLRAAYNYQMAKKDPGAFAHNAKYVMELLFDAITDVNHGVVNKVDMTKAVRGDRGHFDGSSMASRQWDADDAVNAGCSRCHGGQEGFHFYLEFGVGKTVQETANGLECGTCHTAPGNSAEVLQVASTTFPGGVVRQEPGHDNLCSNCHSGRAGRATIDERIASNRLGFVNIHYLPAAGTKLGTAARVGYEYDGKAYAGPMAHTGGAQCTSCHDPVASQHTFMIADAWNVRCRTCHADANGNAENIRMIHPGDYDGDSNTNESLRAEIDGMAERVLKAMQTVTAPGGLCYDKNTFPYFFIDSDQDGHPFCAPAEATSENTFKGWTPGLMKAAHNVQFSRKDPGAWAHNFDYMGQLLYDSVEDLLGTASNMTRP